jgi:hypothetical protein
MLIQKQQMERQQQKQQINRYQQPFIPVSVAPQRFVPSGPVGGMSGGYAAQSTVVLPPINAVSYRNVSNVAQYDPYVPRYQGSSGYTSPRTHGGQGVSPASNGSAREPKYKRSVLKKEPEYNHPQQWR